jgi:hypothetical protein
MLRALFGAVVVAVTAVPTPTPPPQIYRVVSRPLCSQLREHIKPAIGMLLENDAEIKKGPDLFQRYNLGALQGNDSGDTGSNGEQQMALLGLENLVRPIANNVIAIQTILSNPALTTPTGREDDDKRLADMRAKLLRALAAQNASLDIISGFVDTQQMADLQHAGQEYIAEVNQPETTNALGTPTPNSLSYNPNYAGLPPNPYTIDLANVPGLTLGYNPVTRLIDGLHWTMRQTAARENTAAAAVLANAAICNNVPLVSPTP